MRDEEEFYNLRAATAGALLAQHLRYCIHAEARGLGYPDPESIDFDGPEDVEAVMRLMCALVGIAEPDEEAKARMLRLFQALAEVIARKGAELECTLYNIISLRGSKRTQRDAAE